MFRVSCLGKSQWFYKESNKKTIHIKVHEFTFNVFKMFKTSGEAHDLCNLLVMIANIYYCGNDVIRTAISLKR